LVIDNSDFNSIESTLDSIEIQRNVDDQNSYFVGTVFLINEYRKEIVVEKGAFAIIIAVENEQKETFSASSDFEGNFKMQLPPGVYSILISYFGSNSLKIPNIVIEKNTTVRVICTLGEGSEKVEAVKIK
jgi:hypothetical protein